MLRDVTAIMLAALSFAAGTASGGAVERARVDVSVSEGTNMAAAASVSGEIVFDLQGTLWRMPAGGGRARRITDVGMESRFPQWSPDGKRLVFQCYRDNQWQICVTDGEGKQLQQLTSGMSDSREPVWSSDGTRVVFVSDEGGNHDLWEISLATRELRRPARTAIEESYPAVSAQDRLTYVAQDRNESRLMVRSADGQERVLVTATGSRRVLLPSWHPGGTSIAYFEYDTAANSSAIHIVDVNAGSSRRLTAENEDVFASRASWIDAGTLLYTADGGIRRRALKGGAATRIAFEVTFPVERHRYAYRKPAPALEGERPVRGLLRPSVSPDGKRVVFAALSDLWLLEIGQSQPKRLTNDTALDTDAVFSPDGQEIAFASDRRESGTMDLCVIDLRSGQRRVLASPGESVSLPSYSRDGRRIAFLVANSADWHDRVVHILDLQSTQIRKSPQPLFHPSRPSWSADGKTLALSALEKSSSRFRKGGSQVLLIDTASFNSRFIESLPGRSLGVRATNGPEWSPDGTRLAFVADGTLWSLPVSNVGEPIGPPRRLTNDLADSVSWTQDARRVVFLTNGQLRQLDVENGRVEQIPLALTWQPRQSAGRTVIRAGRLFDAVSSTYRRDVDIVIEGRRIAAVQPARNDWPGDVRVIDASKNTVMPGLVESHIHNFTINGEATGRLFLSYGVTSIREVGSDPYDGLESKESWASGARPGPRAFYSGLLEGGRVYYPMSLAIGSGAHLTQELDRAVALDYDLVKTYERLPDRQLARVIDFSHAHGLTVASHDLWPAAAFGIDAIEHLQARDRGEFTDRRSFSGKVYADVIALLRQSGMRITSTAFGFYPGIERPPGADRWTPNDMVQVRDVLPPRYRDLMKVTDAGSIPPARQAGEKKLRAATSEYIMRLRAAGVSVIPATDGSFHLAGLALIREIIGIHNAGVPMHEVLKAATLGAAETLGAQADLGTVEAGKLADLVVLDGDPLERPSDLTNVTMVIKDGLPYTQADLARRGGTHE